MGRRGALVAAALGLAGAGHARGDALFPNGRGPVDVGGPAIPARECAACHPDEHAAWAQSMHGRAWTDPTFRASIASARMASWCLNCHVPLPEQQAALRARTPSELLDEGVTCVVCHQRDGEILTARAPTAAGQDAHALREEPTLASSAFCAGCHQFGNPVTDRFPVHYTREPLQATYDEWRESDVSETCIDCHLDGHAFRGPHDVGFLRSAVSVAVEGRVARVTAGRTGHRVPTGDPFRRLVFRACADAACAEPVLVRTFARAFEETRRAWRLTADTTLTSGETREIPLPDGAVAWELVYYYAEPQLEDELPPDAWSVVVGHGAL